MAYKCNDFFVEAVDDNGIERGGRVCSGYYCLVYDDEQALLDGNSSDQFCLALGYELDDSSEGALIRALGEHFDVPSENISAYNSAGR